MLNEAAVAAGIAPIERVGPMDLTVLATDRGSVPMNIGAVLEFDRLTGPGPRSAPFTAGGLAGRSAAPAEAGPGAARVRSTGVGRRRRFRPRPTSDGAGMAVVPARGALGSSMSPPAVCDRLDRSRPLWRGTLVADPAGERAALVLVFHHVLADGLGGLAVLATLADPGPPDRGRASRGRRRSGRPGRRCGPATDGDGLRDRRRAAPGVAGIRELGSVPRRAAARRADLPESADLTPATPGPGDRSLDEVVALAHRVGGTVNDVMLAAVTGALFRVLAARGGQPGSWCRYRSPVGGPRRRPGWATTPAYGRSRFPLSPTITPGWPRSSPGPAPTPRCSERPRRDRWAWPFATLSRLGMFRLFVEHQRLVHTFETNLRGPAEPVLLGGTTYGPSFRRR